MYEDSLMKPTKTCFKKKGGEEREGLRTSKEVD
jgi:hypothetical protein